MNRAGTCETPSSRLACLLRGGMYRGVCTGRAGRAGRSLDDAGGERVALQRRGVAALALVALVALRHNTQRQLSIHSIGYTL